MVFNDIKDQQTMQEQGSYNFEFALTLMKMFLFLHILGSFSETQITFQNVTVMRQKPITNLH
jgi:hypothetical protein